MTIVPTASLAGAAGTDGWHDDIHDIQASRTALIAHYAGYYGARMAGQDRASALSGAAGDFAQARMLLEEFYDEGELEAAERRWRERSRRFVATHRAAIKKVARELMVVGTLLQGDIDLAIARAAKGRRR